MSMMFDALRVLEMEQREQPGAPFLSEVHLFASTLSADDLSTDRFNRKPVLKAVPGHEDAAAGRSKMDREQLEALRRQVEEDYRLDLAAIERLQRRFLDASSSRSYQQPDERANPQPRGGSLYLPSPPSAPAERQSDEPRASTRADAERWMQGAHR